MTLCNERLQIKTHGQRGLLSHYSFRVEIFKFFPFFPLFSFLNFVLLWGGKVQGLMADAKGLGNERDQDTDVKDI